MTEEAERIIWRVESYLMRNGHATKATLRNDLGLSRLEVQATINALTARRVIKRNDAGEYSIKRGWWRR